MPDRITVKKLEGLCDSINRVTGMPLTPYTRNEDGTFTPNGGCYHLSGQYGGYSLDRMVMDGGTGVSSVFGTSSKRELYDRMYAYLRGLQDARDA